MDKGQAERLMPMLTEMLAEAGVTWHDLSRIAVGTGPGNSTGVRISVAAARGLALGLGIRALGVTRLEAGAFGLPRPLAVVEDARRGDVYVQVFDPLARPARIVPLDALSRIIGGLPVTGSFASVAAEVTKSVVLDQPVPLAEAIARLAAARDPVGAPRPAPFYLRSADATPPSDPPFVILP